MFWNLFKKRFFAEKCFHQTVKKGRVYAFGKSGIIEMPVNENGAVDYCLDCLGKMTIRCAWCNELIFIGEPITLYTPLDDEFKIPNHAVIYQQDPLQLVGCLRFDCADSGIDRAGFWVPGDHGKGRVDRIASPLELAIHHNAVVLANDLTNPLAQPIIIPLNVGEKS